MFDIEKIHKLPKNHRFFDVNDFWYFPNRWVLRVLYPLPVSPNQITFLALVMGIISAGFYLSNSTNSLICAAIFLYAKLFLDNVDGNLARVRGEESRFGRFFDSFTDFSVTLTVYLAITMRLVEEGSNPSLWWLGGVAMFSGLIQCSYFVFYLVNYTASIGTYKKNRSDETITEEDRKAFNSNNYSKGVHIFQWIHNRTYGWQDSLIEALDNYSRKMAGFTFRKDRDEIWYSNKLFLSLSSPLCICTNTMALVVFTFLDKLEFCFWLIIILGNGWLVGLQLWKVIRYRIS